MSWNNSSTTKDFQPTQSNRLKNDIFLKKNSLYNFRNVNTPVVDNSKDNLNQIAHNVNNIVTFDNDNTRYNNMTQEIISKDEELQKYKNEIYQLQQEINDLQREKTEVTTNQVEVKMLKEKLHEQYNLNKEISILQHDLKRATIQIKGQSETISMLKKMINKLRLDKYGSDDFEDQEEPIQEEVNEYLFTDKEFEKQHQIFHNEKLKQMIIKYNQQFTPRAIDELFIEMEIKPDIKITKDLIATILNYLKEEE
ncbi:MAG: hypothetical protein CL470_08990 [Acidimicrobiaceae bacterium]|nr:hypothetical protein [Acidimicrobiaceae bacterium]MBG02390.1 hypothetical protein [Acidimicrobiaceae bacterium]